MLGEEQDGEASEAERRQAAAEQEGPAAAADREAHARRLASPTSLPPPPPRLLLVLTPLRTATLLSTLSMHMCHGRLVTDAALPNSCLHCAGFCKLACLSWHFMLLL